MTYRIGQYRSNLSTFRSTRTAWRLGFYLGKLSRGRILARTADAGYSLMSHQ